MKRVLCLALILALLCACLPAALADDLETVYCAEQDFTTKIPAGMSTQFEEGQGLRVWVETPGYIPHLLIWRRALEKKFNDPVNYLNNVYREYMEDLYGDNMIGTVPCKTAQMGGKTVYVVQYYYMVQDTRLCMTRVVEVRDGGDVEYAAKFIDGEGDAALAALETAVANYTEGKAESKSDGQAVPAGMTAVVCQEQNFSSCCGVDFGTKWEEGNGLYVYTSDFAGIPYVLIYKSEGELEDPAAYVREKYTPHMKEKYGEDLFQAMEFDEVLIGGRVMAAGAYGYNGEYGPIFMIRAFESRDGYTVTYTAKYDTEENGQITVEALDALAANFQPDAGYYDGDAPASVSAPVPASDGKLPLKSAKAQPIVSGTYLYDDGRFSMQLPNGWQVMTESEYTTFCMKAWDPQNPNRAFFLYMKLEPFLKSQEAKQWYVNVAGGNPNSIYRIYAEAPVMEGCTLKAFLDTIPALRDYADLFYDAGLTINSAVLPEIANVEIVETSPSSLPAPADCKENVIARITFEDYLGRQCEGLVTAQPRDPMVYSWAGVDTMNYTVSTFLGVTAPLGELQELEPILTECLGSFTFAEYYVRAAIQFSNEQTEALREQMRQMEAAHDAMMQAWYALEQAHDIAFQQLSDSILGYDRLYDSSTGEVYRAEVGFYDTYDLHRYEYSNSNLQLMDSGSSYYLQGVDYYLYK
ncbi:MAG: hypothetical protein IJS53_05250 [Clostridia bacterium]|nr:hypothetical protein [Clostridia bacterium]